jgi:sugar lactone lactonase YvrE
MKKLIYVLMFLTVIVQSCDETTNSGSTSIVVSTFAGGSVGDVNGAGQSAKLKTPIFISASPEGDLYFTDLGNYKVKKVSPEGTVTTFVGSTRGFSDGSADVAKFVSVAGIAVGKDGTIYVTDSTRVRKITSMGIVSTIAGRTEAGFSNGPALEATFNLLQGIAVASDGTLYVADMDNNKIRKISTDGIVSTLAGSVSGYKDGQGGEAMFDHPSGLEIGTDGNIYVTDTWNHRIRKVTPEGVVTTIAGDGQVFEGSSEQSILIYPMDIAIDSKNQFFVTDTRGKVVSVTPTGSVATVAGSAGQSGYVDGLAADAKFGFNFGIEVMPDGSIYTCDSWNNAIRKIGTK